MIAVLVDQSLAIAKQIALALQPLVQEVYVCRVAGRHARIEDFDVLAEFDPGVARGLAHAILAAHEESGTESLMDEARRSADHLLLFSFREHDALGLAA